MYREKRMLHLFMVLFIVSFLLIPTLSIANGSDPGTRAPGDGSYDDPEITISLDSETFYTEAAPYPDNSATITGDIECIIPSYVPSGVFVKLSVSLISTDINYDGTKDLYATKEEPVVDILISTYPKHSVKAGETYDFEIQVLWSYSTPSGGAGQAEPAYGTIEVSPYGFVFMETIFQNPMMDIIIGEPFEVRFDLYNNGNSECTIELSVVETPDFTEVSLSPISVDMNSFGQAVITATILQKTGSEQEGHFKIRAVSDIPGAPTIDEFTFSIRSYKEEEQMEFDFTFLIIVGFIMVFVVIMVGFIIYLRRIGLQTKEEPYPGGEEYNQ